MNTADLRFAAERGNQPGLLHQPQGMVRELGTMTYRARLFIQPVQQILPQRIHIPFIAPRQHRQIAFPLFQQLEQPVLGQDLGMRPGLAQGGRPLHCAGTAGIKTA